VFVGSAAMGGNRGDVGALFGAQFTPSGHGLLGRGLVPGAYQLVVYGFVSATRSFDVARVVTITVGGSTRMAIDLPANGSAVGDSFRVAGWALDTAAASGTGVDTIHVWAYPVGSTAGPTFLGAATLGGHRPDVGAAFGEQFTASGYNLFVDGLPAGIWDIVVYVHSSVSGAFDAAQVVRVVRSSVRVATDSRDLSRSVRPKQVAVV
jgi:hypothetical protein